MPLTAAEQQELAALKAELARRERGATATPERTPPTDRPGYGLRNAAADAVRIGSGFATPAPLLGSLVGAGAEFAAQKIEGSPTDYGAIGLAGAVPPAMATLGRAGRAVGRMATRMSPSLFRRAHDAALGQADDLVRGLGADDAGALMRQAQQGAATAPDLDVPTTKATLDAMADQFTRVPPLSQGGIKARELVDTFHGLRGGQPVPLAEADAILKELNRVIREKGPAEARALSGSLVQDLEAAAGAGGAQAGALREAAEAYKRQLGAQRLEALIAKAAPSLTGAQGGPALNVANLEKLVRSDKELARWLGPAGMTQVDQFLQSVRGLPPDHAAQFYPMLLAALGGGGGALMGGPHGAMAGLAGVLAPDLARNMFYVGRNPAWLNRGLMGAGQAGRVGLGATLGR